MDVKEIQIMKHYKEMLENRLFDEYDVLGFLIFIRRHLNDTNYPHIKEFTHLVAHRNRDRGHVKDCIVVAIENEYRTENGSRKVVGYHGMEYNEWMEEWRRFGIEFNFDIDETLIEELTLCIFSLAQFTEYNDVNGRGLGVLKLFIGNDNSLALTTTEGKRDSLYVCFVKFGNFNPCRTIDAGYLRNPVEAVRVDGKLRLRDEEGFIF